MQYFKRLANYIIILIVLFEFFFSVMFNVKHYAVSFVNRERKKWDEKPCVKEVTKLLFTLSWSHFFIVALSMKINFSVRTQVMIESVPVGHVTHMKKKKKRIDLATNWENGRKSVVFFLQMDENIFINLEKKLNFRKGRKHSFLWVLRLRWYDWTRFFLQLIYFD